MKIGGGEENGKGRIKKRKRGTGIKGEEGILEERKRGKEEENGRQMRKIKGKIEKINKREE